MEKIKINKTYFKLQGESNFPPKNGTPVRNRVSLERDFSSFKNGMTYQEYQDREIKKRKLQQQLEEDIRKLQSLERQINNGEKFDNPIKKAEAQNFVTNFKRRWYKK